MEPFHLFGPRRSLSTREAIRRDGGDFGSRAVAIGGRICLRGEQFGSWYNGAC